MINFAKLPMNKEEKKIIVAAGLISIFLLVFVVAWILIKRMRNKEIVKLIDNADSDLKFWSDKTETNPSASQTLIDYWKTVGTNFSPAQMQSTSVHSTYPWSSAYISNLVLRSGFENFKPSATHAGYVLDAKSNRKNNVKPAYWAYSPSERKKVELGDILVAPRGSNPTLENLTRSTPTHGDIVVGFEQKYGKIYAIAQGGNLGNKVKQRKFLLSSDRKLTGNTHFAHLKYEK